jgi:TnpA family transposase
MSATVVCTNLWMAPKLCGKLCRTGEKLDAIAIRLRTAETETILRRFTKKNLQHPTYKAFAGLGKAIKTIFLRRYLHDEALRREISEGLNVVEQWNGATDFVFFACRGEMASNRREDHEVREALIYSSVEP